MVSAVTRRLPVVRRDVHVAQPGQRDRDEPVRRCFGRQSGSSGQGVKAVCREFVGRHIATEVTAPRALGQQVPDHAVELLLCSTDALVPVKERRELGAVVPAGLARDVSERPQDRLELFAGTIGLIADLRELPQWFGDLDVVPGEQDRLDVPTT